MTMNRRGFLRTALAGAAAAVGAMLAGKVDAREPKATPGVQIGTITAPTITLTGPAGGTRDFTVRRSGNDGMNFGQAITINAPPLPLSETDKQAIRAYVRREMTKARTGRSFATSLGR
jgi:hypothetical protein